jgi:hypothetical protein
VEFGEPFGGEELPQGVADGEGHGAMAGGDGAEFLVGLPGLEEPLRTAMVHERDHAAFTLLHGGDTALPPR